MSKAKHFVRDQFASCQTLEEAFHRAMGPKLAMLNTPIYRVAREAFFAGAAALDTMQSEILLHDKPTDDPAVLGKKMAALMDRVTAEIENR